MIGLGASGPQVIEGFHGVPYDKPVTRTREIVDILRRGMRREAVTSDGLYKLPLPADQGLGLGKPLKLLNKPERRAVPLFIAALGPKSVEGRRSTPTAGCRSSSSPRRPTRSGARRSPKGTKKRQEGLGPLEVSAGGMVAIGEGDETKALLDFARPVYALYVGGMGARGKNFYNDLACQYGFEKEAKEIQDLYLDGHKRDAEAKVPLEWLEAATWSARSPT